MLFLNRRVMWSSLGLRKKMLMALQKLRGWISWLHSAVLFPCFIVKNFKYTEELKEQYNEYLHTQHLDSIVNMKTFLIREITSFNSKASYKIIVISIHCYLLLDSLIKILFVFIFSHIIYLVKTLKYVIDGSSLFY